MAVYELFIEKAVYKQLKNIMESDYQKIIDAYITKGKLKQLVL